MEGGRTAESGPKHRTEHVERKKWFPKLHLQVEERIVYPTVAVPTRKGSQNLWHNHRKAAMCSCGTSLLLHLIKWSLRKGEGPSVYVARWVSSGWKAWEIELGQ